MPVARLDIEIWRGNNTPLKFAFAMANGDPVDLTGEEVLFNLFRQDGLHLFSVSATGSSSGVLSFALTNAQSRLAAVGSSTRYELEFRAGGREETRVFGNVTGRGGDNTDASLLASEMSGSEYHVVYDNETVTTATVISGPQGPQGATGPQGAPGPQGATGPANSLSIGTVTTGAAGTSASAAITGTAPTQTLSLTIPRGDKGETGSAGATGATGPAGPANSLSIGTVTTGAAGSSAAATITGTAPTQTLSLTIPRGDTGAAGPTVYPDAGIAVSTGTAWGTSKTSPTGAIVGTSDTQTLTNKTLTSPAMTGTAALAGDLAISGTARRITADFSDGTLSNRTIVQSNVSNGSTTLLAAPNGTSTTGYFMAANSSAIDNASIGSFGALSDQITLRAGRSGTGSFYPLTIWTNGAECARFTTTGFFTVGTTSTYGVVTASGASTSTGLFATNATASSGTRIHCIFYDNGTSTGSITTNGSATSYNTSSDYRLKQDVSPLTGALDRLALLKPSRFAFKAAPDAIVDGFLAHEVTPAVPEAVTGEKDGERMQMLDAAKLVPLLTAALQESVARVEALESRLAAIEAALS